MHPPDSELIYDWNRSGGAASPARGKVELDDETLRDGLQSPSVKSPSIDQKIRILHLMEALGIDSADIGLPGAGPHVVETVTRLAQEIVRGKMKIRPNCAARTVAADILPIIEISQKVGIPIEVSCFIGSSPIRQYAEDWDFDRMLRLSEDAVALAVKEGLPVMYVTEDTTPRAPGSHPGGCTRRRSARAPSASASATRSATRRPTACATSSSSSRISPRRWTPRCSVDWHGHQDRGLGVTNALWALEAGAHRVHACALGIGERVGNTPMDQLLVNLQLLGWIDRDLTRLNEYCAAVSEATGVPHPRQLPGRGP